MCIYIYTWILYIYIYERSEASRPIGSPIMPWDGLESTSEILSITYVALPGYLGARELFTTMRNDPRLYEPRSSCSSLFPIFLQSLDSCVSFHWFSHPSTWDDHESTRSKQTPRSYFFLQTIILDTFISSDVPMHLSRFVA